MPRETVRRGVFSARPPVSNTARNPSFAAAADLLVEAGYTPVYVPAYTTGEGLIAAVRDAVADRLGG